MRTREGTFPPRPKVLAWLFRDRFGQARVASIEDGILANHYLPAVEQSTLDAGVSFLS